MQWSMESKYYSSPAVYAAELEMFKHNWWLLGPAQLVEQPGCYLSDSICGWPVFAVRDEHGDLRAFHNFCRHRGALLLEPGSGQCNAIRCPYHSWLYSPSGSLLATPKFGAADQLDKSALGLLPLRVETWQGMVFICISEQANNLLDWLGELPALLREYRGLEQMDYYGHFTVDGEANWKTYCDNTVEGYHLHAVHPRLARAVAAGGARIESYDDGALVAFHVDYGETGAGASLRGNTGLWTFKFPGFQTAVSDNAFKIERIEPLGTGALRSHNWAWYSGLSPAQCEDAFAWSRTVVEEDIGICEKVQTSMQAGFYQSGPLSPEQEQHVASLQRHYLRTLNFQSPQERA